jgi:hypothetical protein
VSPRDWRFSKIDTHYLAPGLRKSYRDKAWPGSDIQDTILWLGTHNLDETDELRPVRDQRIRRIRLCLVRKLLTNNFFVI